MLKFVFALNLKKNLVKILQFYFYFFLSTDQFQRFYFNFFFTPPPTQNLKKISRKSINKKMLA